MGKQNNIPISEERKSRKLNSDIKFLLYQAVEDWKLEYLKEIKALKEELTEVKNSKKIINEQYESLKLEYNKLKSTNKKQENELQSLKAHSHEFTDKEKNDAEKIEALNITANAKI